MLPALPVLLLPVMDEAEELLLFPMGGRTDDDDADNDEDGEEE